VFRTTAGVGMRLRGAARCDSLIHFRCAAVLRSSSHFIVFFVLLVIVTLLA